MEKHDILHSEILEEVIQSINKKYGADSFDSTTIESLIKQAMDICNNSGSRGRYSAPAQIKNEVEKLLNDKTSKRQS